MTVVAWDGRSLAADKMTDFGGLWSTTTKVHAVPGGGAIATTGLAALGAELVNWVMNGAKPVDFPSGDQRNPDKCCSALVITPDGQVLQYEHTPYPIRIQNRHWAIGSGRDFAMAAMFLGHSASGAVSIACALCNTCGGGVDVVNVVGGEA